VDVLEPEEDNKLCVTDDRSVVVNGPVAVEDNEILLPVGTIWEAVLLAASELNVPLSLGNGGKVSELHIDETNILGLLLDGVAKDCEGLVGAVALLVGNGACVDGAFKDSVTVDDNIVDK
jgi:hypothetical protein